MPSEVHRQPEPAIALRTREHPLGGGHTTWAWLCYLEGLIGQTQHATDCPDPILTNATPSNPRLARLFTFLSSEFR